MNALIQRTDGLQPWRRVFHATNGSLIALALMFLPMGKGTALIILGSGLGVQLLVDGLRLTRPELNVHFFRIFTPLVSPREARSIASSTWYTVGVILALALFPRSYAVAGILVMALADPAAALVGKALGRIPLGDGSLEGTLTFFLVALAILALFVPIGPALVAAALGAAAERAPWPLDDNLVLPAVVAGLLFLMVG